jgi:hypothetical protein
MEVGGQLCAPATFTQGNSPLYPQDKKLGGTQSWSGCGGKDKKFFPCLCWESNPGYLVCSLVTRVTSCLVVEVAI